MGEGSDDAFSKRLKKIADKPSSNLDAEYKDELRADYERIGRTDDVMGPLIADLRDYETRRGDKYDRDRLAKIKKAIAARYEQKK